MAIYFITTQQLDKLTASIPFHKKRYALAASAIPKADWNGIFKDSETLAYSSYMDVVEGDEFLFKDHSSGEFILGTIKKVTYANKTAD